MILLEVKVMREIFEEYISVIEDPRCQCDVKHRLSDMLILVMRGVLCGMDELDDIVDFGDVKREFLKKKFGVETIPSRSTLTRIMNMVNAEEMSARIVEMMCDRLGAGGDIIAIDGKTIRSAQKSARETGSFHSMLQKFTFPAHVLLSTYDARIL
jgi:hypothetical protein